MKETPITAGSNGQILNGHARAAAAKELGIQVEAVPGCERCGLPLNTVGLCNKCDYDRDTPPPPYILVKEGVWSEGDICYHDQYGSLHDAGEKNPCRKSSGPKGDDSMNKYIRVTMPDNSWWDVPADEVARNRAEYFKDKHGENFEEMYRETMEDESELIGWAENNMNWEDVRNVATQLKAASVDYQKGWVNGDKQLIEK